MSVPSNPAPVPPGSGSPAPDRVPVNLARAGAWLCLGEGLVLLGFAAFYVVELARGEGSGAGTVLLSAALIAITGGLLLLLARIWHRRSPRAVTPTIVWNLLLVPAALTVYSSGQTLVALLMAVVVVASLATSFTAASRSRRV